ncbi:MAG: hypothetical protein Q8J96_05505 [Rhodocyclaceae bacterium]|nr:hypothetical protein [Rhodocyclaceae bacterium]
MRKIQQRLLPYAFSALALGLLAGCASQQTAPAAAPAPAPKAEAPKVEAAKTATVDNYFLIYHENGRIYPIADAKNYLEFLHTGELIFTRTRVGAGPNGETLVFGIERNETGDLKKPAKAELFFDGKYEPTGPFYGEVIRDGRFLVFGSWHDFKDYLKNKEITFTFTEVGTGPKGETVIYALNKETVKQGRPVKLAEQFKTLHNIK